MKVIRKTLSSMPGIPGSLAVVALMLTLVAPVRAQEREYTTIAPQGARSSTAFGINARGDVVGTFVDQSFVQHGFLLSKGEFTVIDFPEAQGTIARGIGPSGEIVGSYWLPGDNPLLAARGFLRTKEGEFLNVRYGDPDPKHQWEVAQRILPDGTILGCRHDHDQMVSMRGITIGKDGASEIDAFGSMNNGATPDLKLIVGFWFNMMDNQQQSYLIENGVFTSFMVPGSNLTNAWDVNPDGAIVGVYRVGTTTRGFLRTEDDDNNDLDEVNYITIHYPTSAVTRAFGINAGGDIVGNYVLGGVTYAFLAREVED
jgi:probable HAF family extracellular repeat protein